MEETGSKQDFRVARSPEYHPRSEYIDRGDSIADDGAYSELAVSEYRVPQGIDIIAAGRREKPDWLVQQEREEDERSIQDTVNASVNFNTSEKKSVEYKFF